jgi:hypothetical protein
VFLLYGKRRHDNGRSGGGSHVFCATGGNEVLGLRLPLFAPKEQMDTAVA